MTEHCHPAPLTLFTCLITLSHIMTTTVTIRDTVNMSMDGYEFVLDLLTERLTVRELIRKRVLQEVKEYNQAQPEFFRGLVQPTDAEQTLNGFKISNKRNIDGEAQVARALEAFEKNRFLLIVDNKQMASLDDTIEVKPGMGVNFLKLVPLVGG